VQVRSDVRFVDLSAQGLASVGVAERQQVNVAVLVS
jgi:hypothetical protein